MEVRKVIPHEMAVFGLGSRYSKQSFKVDGIINIDYPQAFLQRVLAKDNGNNIATSPVIKAAACSSGYVSVKDSSLFDPKFESWTSAAKQWGVENLFAKGRKQAGAKYTYHCLTNSPIVTHDDYRRIVNILLPYFDIAVMRLLGKTDIREKYKITKREIEILTYMSLGYRNSQISEKLCISIYTVKNHIKNILDKLEVANRTTAVTKSLEIGIIDQANI